MSVQVTAPELADALDSLGASKPGMASGELAEWLLADVVAGHLYDRYVMDQLAPRRRQYRTRTPQSSTGVRAGEAS
jgi:hypothetical protein